MYCTKCGAEIAENNKFCSKCGAAIINKVNVDTEDIKMESAFEEEEKFSMSELISKLKDIARLKCTLADDAEYLYFKELKYRNIVYGVSFIGEKILGAIGTIVMAFYIIQQVQLDEGYKISMYIVGLLCTVVPFFVPAGVFGVIKDILKYGRGDIKDNYEPSLFLGLYIFSYVAAFLAAYPFLNATDEKVSEWVLTIGFGEFIDILECFSFSIILIIISGIVSITIQSIMLMKKDEESREVK